MILAMPSVGGMAPVGSVNVWMAWIDHILNKNELRLTNVAIVHQQTGAVAASNRQFQLSSQDIQNIQMAFPYNGVNVEIDRVVLQSCTYIVISTTNHSMVAFNGNKYLIVVKSKRMFIVAICASRSKSKEAADWLNSLRLKLIRNGY
ncbi:hypothetical protein LSH36_744g00005 [Paralvinella palmiformis]|uniref:Profilin n=1 Tax=Paralvinella palmiformis TaxID=53620 RepID=A0AAD9MUS2_9ANNE|nr:hypothetical protein LSH36_744g00005 [Paralvinella palmiformis]